MRAGAVTAICKSWKCVRVGSARRPESECCQGACRSDTAVVVSFNLFFTVGRKEKDNFRGDVAAAERQQELRDCFYALRRTRQKRKRSEDIANRERGQEAVEGEDVRTGAVGTGDGTGSGDIIEHTTLRAGAAKDIEPLC